MGAEHWRSTRYKDPEHLLPAVDEFRRAVGRGLIVDLGCGPGQLLAQLGRPAVGVDASAGMLQLAHDLGHGPVIRGDMEALPIRSASAAGAFASFSLQHLPRSGFRVALGEARHVLKVGGLLELTMHSGEHDDGVRVGDDMPLGRWFTYWRADDLKAELGAQGFEVLVVEDLTHANRVRARRS